MRRSEAVSGTWFIVATSLPFWRSRTSPSVTYADLPDGRVLDAVHYRKGTKDRLVLGADTPGDNAFRWRGLTPLTRLTSSRWHVVASDESAADLAGRWAVTAFEKTLFTPAGVDVYCRAAGIAPAAMAAARATLTGGLGAFLPQLFEPGRG